MGCCCSSSKEGEATDNQGVVPGPTKNSPKPINVTVSPRSPKNFHWDTPPQNESRSTTEPKKSGKNSGKPDKKAEASKTPKTPKTPKTSKITQKSRTSGKRNSEKPSQADDDSRDNEARSDSQQKKKQKLKTNKTKTPRRSTTAGARSKPDPLASSPLPPLKLKGLPPIGRSKTGMAPLSKGKDLGKKKTLPPLNATGNQHPRKVKTSKTDRKSDRKKNLTHSLQPIKKGPTILQRTHTYALGDLNNKGLEELWLMFDKNRDGKLNRKEMFKMAMLLNNKILDNFRMEMKEQHPGWSNEKIEKAVKDERYYLLPGQKEKDEAPAMVKTMISKLDINNDGDVSKAEFKRQWRAFAADVFKPNAKPTGPSGDDGCSIM